MASVSFEIQKNFGVLGKNNKEWQKEINLVKWQEGRPKLDIRDWDPQYKKMGRGITLTPDEVEKAIEVLNGLDIDLLRKAYGVVPQSGTDETGVNEVVINETDVNGSVANEFIDG